MRDFIKQIVDTVNDKQSGGANSCQSPWYAALFLEFDSLHWKTFACKVE